MYFLLYVPRNPFVLHVLKIPKCNNILGTEELVPLHRWFEKPWVDQYQKELYGPQVGICHLSAYVHAVAPSWLSQWFLPFPASTLFLLEHCLPAVPPAMQGFSKELGREAISAKGREKG